MDSLMAALLWFVAANSGFAKMGQWTCAARLSDRELSDSAMMVKLTEGAGLAELPTLRIQTLTDHDPDHDHDHAYDRDLICRFGGSPAPFVGAAVCCPIFRGSLVVRAADPLCL
mmetsp:Transcript_24763/g.36900  ORF Transcript_24763/g.36900 Transcript_24763/m.36900 type:complete len:114 (-) Transcript_24763:501-842(-)